MADIECWSLADGRVQDTYPGKLLQVGSTGAGPSKSQQSVHGISCRCNIGINSILKLRRPPALPANPGCHPKSGCLGLDGESPLGESGVLLLLLLRPEARLHSRHSWMMHQIQP